MNMAEKYIKENVKTITINGIEFLVRKYNPEDVFIMGQHLVRIRDRAKKRIAEDEPKEEDCEDCPDKPLRFTSEEIQELGELDLRVVLTRCVLDPRIVMKSYGTQKENEIPFEVLDSNTANKLFKEIEDYSLEVFEGVSFGNFPDQRDGNESNEDSTVLQDSSEPASGFLSPEDESILEDEIGRILRPDQGDGAESKKQGIGQDKKRVRKKKTRIEREIQKKNNK